MMISRTLLAALCCAYAAALSPIAPLTGVGDSGDCALYLNGPGRTSAYDYSINLLKGNFGYEGQANCITYEAINQAYLEARNRILVSQPKGDWKAEDFASVGELILDISISLARRYALTYEEVEKGLPLIDTSRTLIREVCPPVFSHVECRAGKYRRLDGLCNNLQHPTWGATMAPFQRLIGPLFADGINAPRIAHHGKDLPLSRVVSRTMHPDEGFHDHAGTVMVIAWGQFMDHDYTLTATPLDPVNRNDPEECCKRPPHLKHPYCNEIRIPDDDYFYRLFGVKCIDFVRGFPSPRPGCRLGSRAPFNTLTGAIDGNTVYGVTEKFARKLRTGFGGLLRMNPVFKEYGLKDLLPLKLDIPDEGCTRPNKNMYCFEAGEIRVNEQLVLTVMHTLMAREHNRVANALAEVNPHWDDETLFQEARRINIAEIQHITYNEFLPILLGKDVMEKFGLVLEKEGYWDGYDPEVNPDVIASFAAAAYRFGHSLLPTAVERWSKAHKFIASKRLSDLIRRPYDLYRAGVLDEYVMGLMNQVAQAMDDSITQEVTNHLFKKVGARFGMDLVSFNMQRGREFGLPGYMEFRKFCGLPPADTFQDLFGSMPNATVQKYETIFDHPIDVDLWSGGVSERPLPGSMLGPTFACVIATQFSYSRRGDRFWFELPNQPSSFTPEQLVEIRKARLARVICDNTDIIDTVQLYPMVLPDHELNPRVPCRSGIIPSMDFSKWAEPAPFHGAAKQYMTNATIFENNSTSENGNIQQNCNTTGDSQNCTVSTVLVPKNDCSHTNNTDCNVPVTSEANHSNDTKKNQIGNSDTVLKYVYKKDDKTNILNKSTGHPKNSINRRKRSTDDPNDSPLPSKIVKPTAVNYETAHGAPTGELIHRPPNTISGANLADFSIQTVHDGKQNQASPAKDSSEHENDSDKSNESKARGEYTPNNSAEKSVSDSEESGENQDYRKLRGNNGDNAHEYPERIKPTGESNDDNKSLARDESDEYHDQRNRPNSQEADSSGERGVAYRNNKPNYEEENSREHADYNTKQPSRLYDESGEVNNYKNLKPRGEYHNNRDEQDINVRNGERDNYKNGKPIQYENSSEEEYTNKKPSPEHYSSDEREHRENLNTSSAEDSSNEHDNYKNKKASGESDTSSERAKHRSSEHSRGYDSSNERGDYVDRAPVRDSSSHRRNDKLSSEYSNSEEISKETNLTGEKTEKSFGNKVNAPINSEKYLTAQFLSKEASDEQTKTNSAESDSSETHDRNNFKRIKPNLEKSNEYKQDDSSQENQRLTYQNNEKNNFNVKPKLNLESSSKSSSESDEDDSNQFGIKLPQTGNLISDDPKKAVEILPLTTALPQLASNSKPPSNDDNVLNPKINRLGNKLIHINDGEVKPVVEIHAENDNESSEETKSSNSDESDSLESLLGVKGSENLQDNSQSDKLVREHKAQQGDVKQQFERIPLNYKHDDNNDNKVTEAPKEEKSEVTKDEGTLDVFAPEDVKYDANLNIKFDDLAIKLPEIKLPDDILSYTHDNYPFHDKKESKHSSESYDKPGHYYNQDNKARTRQDKNEKDKHNDNDSGEQNDRDDYKPESNYYDYYGHKPEKSNYKRKDSDGKGEEDEDEDLYEKFVRERFGKRGTFEKRSEKLEAAALSPHLYDTVKSILKKTADIDEQAKKSGDPNANYMWTLEYGEKL